MASAKLFDALKLGEIKLDEAPRKLLSMEEMQKLQVRFAKEAFIYLARHAQILVENPEDCSTGQTDSDDDIVFTTTVGKAIVTLAYLLRIEFRKKFRTIMNQIKDPAKFEDYVKSYHIHKCKKYFFHILEWTAFTFETTVLCYKSGYNYFQRGEECIAKYPDLEFFHLRGGWKGIIEYSKKVAQIYGRLKSVIGPELPQDDVIVPFLVAAKNIELQKRSSDKSLATPDMVCIRVVRKTLSKRYAVIPSSDPQSFTRGYKVIRKKLTPETSQGDSQKSPKEPLAEASMPCPEQSDDLIDLTAQMDEATISENASDSDSYNLVSPCDVDFSKSIFILRESFLNKRKESLKDPNSKYKRSLETLSPSDEIHRLTMDINQILDENIEKENYFKLGKSTYAICSPGCTIHDESTQFQLMRDSSEEEDDSFAESCSEMIRKFRSRHVDRTGSEFQEGQESKCIAEIPSKELECVPSKATESGLEESSIEMSTEQASEPSKTSEPMSPEKSEIPSAQMSASSISIPDQSDSLDLASQMDAVSEYDSDSSLVVSTSDVDYSKSVFVIREKFLNKRKEALKDPNSEYRRNLQTYSPSDEIQTLTMNINEILDECIENENYFELGNGAYAVCPPGRTIDDKDSQFHLLQDSEEEDGCSAESFREILHKLRSEHKVCTSPESREAHESKCTAEIPSEQLECMESKSTESEFTDSATNVPLEEKFVPTESTGAVPKVEKSDSKKRPKKGQSTSSRKSKKKGGKSKK